MALHPVPFALPDASGAVRRFPTGRYALLFFQREDCPTCELVFQLFEQTSRAFGTQVDAWVVSQDGMATAARLIARHGLTAPVLDDGALVVSRAWGVDAVPALVLADAAGAIIRASEGFSRRDWRETLAELARLTGGAPPLVPWANYPEFRPGCASRTLDLGRDAPAATGLRVVQMHGEPGAGKTTLARELGRAIDAVVLEMDVIASVLLWHGVSGEEKHAIAYDVQYSLAASLLAQGFSVVLDNPVFQPAVEQRSIDLARQHGASWSMVECACPDDGERQRRLRGRERLEEQSVSIEDWRTKATMSEPRSERLVVDTRRALAENVDAATRYINDQT